MPRLRLRRRARRSGTQTRHTSGVGFRSLHVEVLEPRLALSAAYSFEVVAQTNTTLGTTKLTHLGLPSINDAGQVAFFVTYEEQGEQGKSGIATRDSSSQPLRLVAKEFGNRVFGSFVEIDNNGQILVAENNVPNDALALWDSRNGCSADSLTNTCRSQQLVYAPDLGLDSIFSRVSLSNNTGQFAFVGDVIGSSSP